MTSDELFDRAIAQAKQIVTAHRTIAADAFPKGAVLTCSRCGYRETATSERVGRFLATGWPQHCGLTMLAEGEKWQVTA